MFFREFDSLAFLSNADVGVVGFLFLIVVVRSKICFEFDVQACFFFRFNHGCFSWRLAFLNFTTGEFP